MVDNDYRGELLLRFKYIWQPEDYFIIADPNEERQKSFTNIDGKLSCLNWRMAANVNTNKIYKKGDKIGQLVSEVTNHIDWIVVADLSATMRGHGGFGSTTTISERKIEVPKEATAMVNRWKEAGAADIPAPERYESAAREREKAVANIPKPITKNYESAIREREKHIK